MNTQNIAIKFWTKFSRYLLIGFSAMVLLAGGQQMQLGRVLAQSDDGNFEYVGSYPLEPEQPVPAPADDGNFEYVGSYPLPTQQPVPQQPAAQGSTCGDFSFRYNECFACNQSRKVFQDSCGVYKTEVNSGTDAACASWCSQQPAQPVSAQPAPQQPAPQAAVSGPGNPSISGSPFCEGSSPAITWNYSVPTNADTMDLNIPGSIVANQTANSGARTQRNLSPNQRFDASIVVRNSAGANSAATSVNSLDCGVTTTPAVPSQCSAQTYQQQRCVSNQLCTFEVTDNLNNICGARSESNPFGCYVSSGCGGVQQCSEYSRQAQRCIGNQLCLLSVTVNSGNICGNTQYSSPYSCSYSSSCGFFQPGPSCTAISCSTPPSGCSYVNQRLSTCSNESLTCGQLSCVNTTQNVTVTTTAGTAVVYASTICPTGTTKKTTDKGEVVCEVTTQTQVKGVTYASAGVAVKELPKTGLPALAWALGAFLPAGLKLKRFGRDKDLEPVISSQYLWEKRQFDKV